MSLGGLWSIAPAADPGQVIVVRDPGDENRTDQQVTVELVDGSAAVIRSTLSSWVNVAGELEGGELVCSKGPLTWYGDLRPSLWAGDPIAVIAGRHVLAAKNGVACMYDTREANQVRCELPDDAFLLSPVYDSATASVVRKQWRQPWALVAGESIGVHVVDVGFAQHSAAWLDRDRLLLLGEGEHVLLELRSGERTTVDGIPRGAHPRVDVTGRFDFEQLKAAQRPRFAGPIPRTVQYPTMPDGHMHLLRLDSDSLNGTLYGDGGSLQITIPADLPFQDALAHAEITTDST